MSFLHQGTNKLTTLNFSILRYPKNPKIYLKISKDVSCSKDPKHVVFKDLVILQVPSASARPALAGGRRASVRAAERQIIFDADSPLEAWFSADVDGFHLQPKDGDGENELGDTWGY